MRADRCAAGDDAVDLRSVEEIMRKPVLTTRDIMRVLGVGDNTVRELVDSKAIARLDFSPHVIKVDRRELLRFLREQTEKSRGRS